MGRLATPTFTLAIFGSAWRWDWFDQVSELVVCCDYDENQAGQNAARVISKGALTRGIPVSVVTADELGGCNDANEALQKGVLQIENGESRLSVG